MLDRKNLEWPDKKSTFFKKYNQGIVVRLIN